VLPIRKVPVAVLTPNERPRRWTLDDIVVTDPPIIRRAIGAAAIGNITEWYDFGVYAYFEPTIREVFFSDLGDTAGTVATFGLFAVAFLVRPFGGMFFGPLADRIGRNKVLAITMIMMALGTFAIGCIPSHSAIGLAAPILLLCARLVQGFSTGGEYGNAMTFIAEYAPDRRRGFLGSLLEFGTFTGYLFGALAVTLATALLSEDQLLSWGWRLPFFVALPLGLVGVYLRARLADTPAYQELEKEQDEREKERKGQQQENSLKRLLKLWPFALVCMGLVLLWNVTNYMLTSYMPTYVTETVPDATDAGVSTTTSQWLQIAVTAAAMVGIPLFGMLSDRVGRKPIVWTGVGILVLGSFPMLLLIREENALSVFLGLLIMGIAVMCFSSTLPSTLPSLFPTDIRGTGLSVSFNVSVSLFGGTTSLVVGSLVGATGNLDWPAYYLIAAGLVGAVSLLFLREPNGRRMWGSAPAAVDEAEARRYVKSQKVEAA
jgi:MFS transporter, MHS family, proline/betaine transporter